MSETVPLESVSRWSGLSPWVALLPWRMAGAASPGVKSGAASAEGRVRGKPPESSPGQAPSCIGATGPTPGRSRGEDLWDACGVGGRGMEARRGAGGGVSDPRAGCCLVERSARSSSRREAATRGPSRALKRPFASRVVNRCLRYDSARPLFGQDRGQAFAKGLSPRRLRPETTLPGRQRIPRTAATSSVPPSPVGTRAAALPVPWL